MIVHLNLNKFVLLKQWIMISATILVAAASFLWNPEWIEGQEPAKTLEIGELTIGGDGDSPAIVFSTKDSSATLDFMIDRRSQAGLSASRATNGGFDSSLKFKNRDDRSALDIISSAAGDRKIVQLHNGTPAVYLLVSRDHSRHIGLRNGQSDRIRLFSSDNHHAGFLLLDSNERTAFSALLEPDQRRRILVDGSDAKTQIGMETNSSQAVDFWIGKNPYVKKATSITVGIDEVDASFLHTLDNRGSRGLSMYLLNNLESSITLFGEDEKSMVALAGGAAPRFMLIDRHGNPRSVLTLMNPGQDPSLIFFDDENRKAMELSSASEGNTLSFAGADGRRLSVGSSPQSIGMEMKRRDLSRRWFVGADHDEKCRMVFLDDQGKTRISIDSNRAESGLRIGDGANVRVSASLDVDNGSTIRLKDDRGAPIDLDRAGGAKRD